ncbi:hypothetical protein ANACOL_02658 [Anaerotruncus colihominis DSM 17241]|uniref:Uncharacterized protein n=1 Tax=Anaerotruncus colihominis DSM 17241 TaxID=445972 RepID=B0PCZ5_9FIRM|nr:hypothetical protein ANACOL_02658 [Anaerotruncus colihominis DSM 17241]
MRSGGAYINAAPGPLFAAQPIKVFWLTFFSKKVSFKKGKFQKRRARME